MRVWDASISVELNALNGYTDVALSVALSSDGTPIVSGSLDNSVRMGAMKSWMSTPNNWIISLPYSKRLLWLPPDLKQVLCHSHHLLTISPAVSASVSFINSKVGAEWAECYVPSAF